MSENSEVKKSKVKKLESKRSEIIFKKIVDIVGEERVRKDEFERRMYSHDLAPLPKMMEISFKMMPDYVVKPESAEEVAKIVKVAIKEQIPIIPRGAATSAFGGAVPTQGGIVLDMTNMNDILEIDEENLCAMVEPGVIWKTLYDTLLDKGFFLGAYPSSAPAATVGGWINTGGVGIGSYKYGGAGNQIRSLEVVLPNGNIIETGFKNVIPNSSGYNLNDLFVGSEGTLGIVTKVTLKIHPGPEELRPLSYAFHDLKAAFKVINELVKAKITPLHIGFLDGTHFELLRKLGKDVPDVGGMLNIALEGDRAMIDYEERIIDQIMEKYGAEKQSKEVAKHEWEERSFEFRVKRLGPTMIGGEVFIPVNKFQEAIDGINVLIKKMKLRGWITGVVSDRNTVAFMPYYLTDERKLIKFLTSMAFIKKLGDLAFKLGGRPAGLGIFFAFNLKRMHGDGAATMHDIKVAIDPYNIMNPGKLTEGLTRFGFPIPALAMNLGMDAMAIIKSMLPKER